MRPVNLIPKEDRRGVRVGGRSIVSYTIVGVLLLVLGVVSLLAVFDKRTDERQAEVASLESQVAAAQAEASSLSSFTSFKQVHDARIQTIDSLAKSRFDWERVMRELAIVIPDYVWLTNLTGTATPAAQVTNGAGLALRASITGPALEMTGCAQNQRTVARLIAAINDIDGVTRVLVSNSVKPEPSSDDASATGSGDESAVTTCAIRPSYPSFELVAAFDGVAPADPAAADAAAATVSTTDASAAPATATPPTDTTSTAPETTTTTPIGDDGGVANANDQNTQEQSDVRDAQQEAQDAAQIPSGGGDR